MGYFIFFDMVFIEYLFYCFRVVDISFNLVKVEIVVFDKCFNGEKLSYYDVKFFWMEDKMLKIIFCYLKFFCWLIKFYI